MREMVRFYMPVIFTVEIKFNIQKRLLQPNMDGLGTDSAAEEQGNSGTYLKCDSA